MPVTTSTHSQHIHTQTRIEPWNMNLRCASHMPNTAAQDTKWSKAAPAEREKERKREEGREGGKFSLCISRITWAFGWKVQTEPDWWSLPSAQSPGGGVLFIKSIMISRFSCCRIRSLWLPSRLKAALNMISDPWRKIIFWKTQRSRRLNQISFWWNDTLLPPPPTHTRAAHHYF